MKKLRVYIDTSVIGGCFDEEFSPWSNGLMRDFREGHFLPVVSTTVAAEIGPAPAVVGAKYVEVLGYGAEMLELTSEALDLVEAYAERAVLPLRFRSDLEHIAIATVAAVDVLVSWNFKHIVHLDKIRVFNGVNLELGYAPLQIYSPREVTSYE